jgi:uncharacterized cupredoxin-like copper-binding protein
MMKVQFRTLKDAQMEVQEMFRPLRQYAPFAVLVIITALALTACGGTSAQASNKPATVQVTLSEFKIESSQTTFSTGTPYTFVIKNAGTIPHEWEIMPRGEKDVAKALFRVEQGDLQPGATVTREFTFKQAGNYEFSCLLPGHYEAGMVLPIVVK